MDTSQERKWRELSVENISTSVLKHCYTILWLQRVVKSCSPLEHIIWNSILRLRAKYAIGDNKKPISLSRIVPMILDISHVCPWNYVKLRQKICSEALKCFHISLACFSCSHLSPTHVRRKEKMWTKEMKHPCSSSVIMYWCVWSCSVVSFYSLHDNNNRKHYAVIIIMTLSMNSLTRLHTSIKNLNVNIHVCVFTGLKNLTNSSSGAAIH